MEQATTDFGNTSWIVYVVAAYGVTLAALGLYSLFSFRTRSQALQSLKNEGFLAEKDK